MSNQFQIAYSVDNQHLAKEIDHHLSSVGIQLNHIMVGHNIDDAPLQQRLNEGADFVLLLISDNFLKNVNCMDRGLFMLQDLLHNERAQCVIIDGVQKIEGTNEYKTVPTKFERMTHVIKYMNYWQDYYLDLRKEKRNHSEDEEQQFNEYIKVVRSVSAEMSDFLKTLKNSNYWTFEQMSHNGYELFFNTINKPGLHEALLQAIARGEIPATPPVIFPKNKPATPPTETTPAPPTETPAPPTETIVNTLLEKTAPAVTAASIIESRVKKETKEVKETKEIVEVKAVKKEVKKIIETPLPLEKSTPPISPKTKKETPTPPQNAETKPTDTPPQKEVVEPVASKATEVKTTPPPIKKVSVPDEELLKISEKKLKEKGRTPLLDKLIKHRREVAQMEKQTEQKPSESNDSSFEETINEIIEEEKVIAITPPSPTPTTTKPPRILSEIFHDEDEELDSNEIIGNFELSSSSSISKKKKRKKLDWKTQLQQAKHLIQSGKLYAGLNMIREAVEKNQSQADLRFEYAIHLMDDAESYKAATRELEKVIQLDENNVAAYTRLAVLAEIKEDYLLAKSYYEKALELKNDAHSNYLLAVLLTTKFPDLQDQAANYFKKSLKKDSDNPDAHYRYGLILEEHLKKPKKALSHFEKTLELMPNHPFVNYDLALMHYRAGDFSKAKKYYQQACALNPELQTATNDRAFLGVEKIDKSHLLVEVTKEAEEVSSIEFSQEEATAATILEKTQIPKSDNFEKVVLISGSTSGIGKATATLFASNGYRVILTGRRADRLEAIKADLENKYPTQVETLQFDVGNIDAAQAAIASLNEKWNSIDILINNAGLAKGFEPIHEGKLEDWEAMINTNVKGLLFLTRLVAPGMVARRKGHIINVCSTAGHEVYPNGNVYCATKHAVDALTKGMRLDLYKHGLRVGQVSPAHVEETEFARVRFDWDVERAKIYNDFQPLRAEDVANAIYFIATQPEHVNIQDIVLMGKQQANSTNIDRSGRK
ncbi:MAG TPA: SDR family NAD(P)-dependent oxidoreductase [Phaeodactylibacter sp.]|nr:SDR family NAD(P)-dependent oxidoreductase [Phaeodactylibacter sp.]